MYFSQVRIDPNDPEVVYLGGVGLHQSHDGGKTVATDVAGSTHDDVHAIWIDPANSNHVLIGNDGGVAVSYDMAKTWVFLPTCRSGTFYHVSYDMATPYNVCGGMQDNYDWCGPSAVRGAAGIAQLPLGDACRAATASSCCRTRPTAASSTASRRTATWSASTAMTFETMSIRPQAEPGRAGAPLALGHAAASSRRTTRRSSTRRPTRCSARPTGA